MRYFQTKLSKTQCSDTGMAMTLILLLIGFFTDNTLFYKAAIPVLLLNMIYPRAFYPLAVVWLGGSNLLGAVVSKILLTIIYLLIVLPVAIIRRLSGRDSLKIKAWKKSTETGMSVRDHLYTKEDLIKPF